MLNLLFVGCLKRKSHFIIGIKMLFDIFTLLVLFQIKHLIADYFLQGKWMLQKFRADWGFFYPLLTHASVHALFTLAICLFFAPHLWWLALVDLVVHFIMDRIKAGPKYLGRFKALSGIEYKKLHDKLNRITGDNDLSDAVRSTINQKFRYNVYFWWSLGMDQMSHNLTHYFIIYVIIMDKVLLC